MAGGKGIRLSPLTFATSKQLLPVFDKPLIYYPLSVLMQTKIREILIISTPNEIPVIKNLLKDGTNLGLEIKYRVQKNPTGIADGINLAKSFIGDQPFALILGDNIFHGQRLYDQICIDPNFTGSTIFVFRVKNPSRYGVIELNEKNEPLSIEEKPVNHKSNFAVTGLYFFDSLAIKVASKLSPSVRGELEITDVLQSYIDKKLLNVKILAEGTTWLDAGTPESLHDAGTYIRIIEQRQGIKVACLEEIAFNNGWISTKTIHKIINSNPHSEYFLYLRDNLLKHN
jgi:glucose-1-phosphate thymidylyltransferase